jgi:fructoselysine-6-P-deglycase FrlB-like protein
MRGTFRSQFDQLKTSIRRRYGNIAERVHNIRANLTTAIVFVGHGGSWAPWECA